MTDNTIEVMEAERVTIWVVTDNYYDALRSGSKIAKRFSVKPGQSIHAEHGLSYYIETEVNGKTSACMFDYGIDPMGVMNNIRLLNLDLDKLNAFALSHGHFDHWTGAAEIIGHTHTRTTKTIPFFAGEETFLPRFALLPGSRKTIFIGQLKKEDLESLGVKVTDVKQPAEIIPGAYLTGNIERVTAYEKVNPNLLVRRGQEPEPDDFRGEQAVFFNVKNKGLLVLSGCAHAGIVNTVLQARKVAGIEKLHAVMGGFHLIHAPQDVIWSTLEDLRAMNPDFIAPTHCTGFEAVTIFSQAMPEEFNLNTAGTQYTFTA